MSVTPPLTAVHNFLFTHSCRHGHGCSCCAWRLLFLTSNLGFRFLLKGTSTWPQSDSSLFEIDPASRSFNWATVATITRAPLLRCQLPSHPLQWFRSFKSADGRHPDPQRWIPMSLWSLYRSPLWPPAASRLSIDAALQQQMLDCHRSMSIAWMERQESNC